MNLFQPGGFQADKSVFRNGLSYIFHQSVEKIQVVDGSQPEDQQLPVSEKMVQIGPAEMAAGITLAILYRRIEVLGKTRFCHVIAEFVFKSRFFVKKPAHSPQSGRHYTIQ